MAGGLLNIVSVGNVNVILTGNPTKTFFKCTYSKYTNFGLQKFRIDYDGMRDLRLTDLSTFTFKIPRYAELLMDTYLVVTIPDIWSPFYHPCDSTGNQWAPYDFKWIDDLGTHMIKEITITCGSLTLQKYSGEYLAAMVERDFHGEKKRLFNAMTGNVPELNDPSNAFGRQNTYPSAVYTDSTVGAEPSIRGRDIYVPINTWFTLDSRCAFPLISLQYNELVVTVTIRPIQELFKVRDVFDASNNYPYMQPDFNQSQFNMYRYLQTPPSIYMNSSNYSNTATTWNADVHLISTYAFLSKEERELFASQEQLYLVKDVFEYKFQNVTGSKIVQLTSNGMIANWMWFMRRNDAYMRNEWSNYTNWPYKNIPQDVSIAPSSTSYTSGANFEYDGTSYGPGRNPPSTEYPYGKNTGFFYSGDFFTQNRKEILETAGIKLNGDYRENLMTRGIYDYVEKYVRTQSFAKEGLYCYNFCLNTSPFEYQPSGAINLSKFKTVELEITTFVPSINKNASYDFFCDASGTTIGVRKQNWQLYDYNYDMVLYEERYNVLTFMGGNCGMLYAR